jgi:hypothetical protein
VQLLRTVRVYAAERLAERGEADAVADRHADWFLGRAARVDLIQDRWAYANFAVMVGEADDIRRAMDRVLTRGDVRRVAAFASATWGWFWLRGQLTGVRPWFEAAVTLADRPGVEAMDRGVLLYTVGQIRVMMGDPVGAEQVLLPALEVFDAIGYELGSAGVRIALSAANPELGRSEEGYRQALEALEIGERHGHPHVIGFAAAMVGSSRLVRGDLEGAIAAHERSVEVAREVGFPILEAQALAQLAVVEAFAGANVPRAWRYLAESAAILRGTRNREILSYWLEFAAVALEGETPADALLATTAGEAVRDELQVALWPLMRPFHDVFVVRLRDVTGDRADAIVEEGAGATPGRSWTTCSTSTGLAPEATAIPTGGHRLETSRGPTSGGHRNTAEDPAPHTRTWPRRARTARSTSASVVETWNASRNRPARVAATMPASARMAGTSSSAPTETIAEPANGRSSASQNRRASPVPWAWRASGPTSRRSCRDAACPTHDSQAGERSNRRASWARRSGLP